MSRTLTVVTDDVKAKWVGDLVSASAALENIRVDVKEEHCCGAEGRCSDVLIDVGGIPSGLSFIQRCRECSPDANIFVAANAEPWPDFREAYRLGATDVIPKNGFENEEEVGRFLKRMVARPRIILADNNEELRETWRDLLSEEYEVLEAASPAEARRILAMGNVDLAILDIRLVDDSDELDTSGLEVAKATSIPVIFLTNYPTSESVSAALHRRLNGRQLAAEFIHKHEPVDVLLEAARRILRHYFAPADSKTRSGDRLTQSENPASGLFWAMAQLREALEEISSGYHDVVSREHAWRAFQRLATEALWDSVKDLEDDPYRQQLADVLDAAIARLQAFQLEEKHLSAIDLTLSLLSAPEATEEDVDACQNAWRDVGVDTLPSLGEAFEEWLASSEMRLEHAG